MKRFYKQVSCAEVSGGWQVMLDGRGLKTAGRQNPQIAPSWALAQQLASEWDEQGETLDPRSLAMRDLTDFALDIVAADPDDIVTKTIAYGETDTLCFRADPEDALFERQQAEWEPIIAAVEERENIRFTRVSGIIHRAHPPETLDHLRNCLADLPLFQLAGLHTMASLAASLCIGLEALENDADPDALWQAAVLEEEWQAELWGRDSEAELTRSDKRAAFLKAFQWTQLARASG